MKNHITDDHLYAYTRGYVSAMKNVLMGMSICKNEPSQVTLGTLKATCEQMLEKREQDLAEWELIHKVNDIINPEIK